MREILFRGDANIAFKAPSLPELYMSPSQAYTTLADWVRCKPGVGVQTILSAVEALVIALQSTDLAHATGACARSVPRSREGSSSSPQRFLHPLAHLAQPLQLGVGRLQRGP